MKRVAEERLDGSPKEKRTNVKQEEPNFSSSLPQYRLGTVASEEELNQKVEEFAKSRLVELVDAEKKIKGEAIERAVLAERKLSEKKAFYRIIRSWWCEFNLELGKLTSQTVDLSYRWPTDAEIEEEREKADGEQLRIFGEQLRTKNDFTFQCIKRVIEKVDDSALRTLTEETVKKNRELNAELEKVENDMDEKTELCEDLRHKCEQLTKRNARLIGQMGTRAATSKPIETKAEIKAEPSKEESKEPDEQHENEVKMLKNKIAELQTEKDRLEMRVNNPNEATIVASSVYQSLKAQFSVLYNQADLLKRQGEESRQSHEHMRTVFLKQLEQMELDELQIQEKIRQELKEVEQQYQSLQIEHDKLYIEYQQNLKQNEQATPINREMRQLINSLQMHNRQLKAEVNRYKKKVRDYQTDLDRQKSINDIKQAKEEDVLKHLNDLENDLLITGKTLQINERTIDSLEVELHREKEKNAQLEAIAVNVPQDEIVLVKQQLAAMEARFGALSSVYCRRLGELPRELLVMEQERKKLQDEFDTKLVDSGRKLQEAKTESEALLNEMDKTGQAYEEMQEQNIRLIQQVRDKDKEYFSLFQERIKISNLQQIQAKEKEVLESKITQLEAQVESQNKLVRSLEEKEGLQTSQIKNAEQELQLRSQALELHKRRSIELAQLCQDQKRKEFEKQNEINEVQKLIRAKNDQIEDVKAQVRQASDANERIKRTKKEKLSQEDMLTMVLTEEIDGYKKKLKCPICNIEEKDAILTKCFHVFCYKCLKTRYETRQRKCPKCNQNFGGNDYHKIYIE